MLGLGNHEASHDGALRIIKEILSSEPDTKAPLKGGSAIFHKTECAVITRPNIRALGIYSKEPKTNVPKRAARGRLRPLRSSSPRLRGKQDLLVGDGRINRARPDRGLGFGAKKQRAIQLRSNAADT